MYLGCSRERTLHHIIITEAFEELLPIDPLANDTSASYHQSALVTDRSLLALGSR